MFGSKKKDAIIQARSKENKLPIVFVHTAEFLVTDADGSAPKSYGALWFVAHDVILAGLESRPSGEWTALLR